MGGSAGGSVGGSAGGILLGLEQRQQAAGIDHVEQEARNGFAGQQPAIGQCDAASAGVAFAVGVISALLEGQTLAAAASRGNQLGARAVGFPGDCDGLPTRAQLQAS